MLFGNFRDKHNSGISSPGFNLDHPAIVAVSYIALLLFAVLLHRGAWNGAWKEDDARQLVSIINNPLWRLLFDPYTWQHTYATVAFMPVVAVQYWVDILLFGLHARGFNLHHAAELAITTITSYHLLSRRIPRHLALLATIGFLVAMPTFTVMNFLMARHYLAGLLLSICSVYMYQRAQHDSRSRTLFISIGLFFLAMLAKELYAVALLYFFLASWRTPLFRKTIALYSLALVIFVAWRAYMLGGFLGGYPNAYPFIERIAVLDQVHRAIFGSDLVAVVFLACVVVLIFRHRLFGIRHLVGLVAVLVAIYAPLVFSTFVLLNGGIHAPRLSLFPVWLCATGLAYIATLLHETGARKTAGILMVAFVAAAASVSVRSMDDFRANLDEYEVQARFIENAGPKSALFPSAVLRGPLWNHFYQQVALAAGHTPPGLVQVREDIFPGFSSYWEYSPRCRCMVQLPYADVLEKASHLDTVNRVHEGAPISLHVTWQARGDRASIIVLPEGESWCLLSVPGMHPFFPCPRSSISLASLIPKDKFGLLHVQVLRERKDGLTSVTPYLSAPAEGTVQWGRGVFLPHAGMLNGKPAACHIDAPGNKELHLAKTSPFELRGWILGLSNPRPDTLPLAILAGSAGKNYAANLYREPRPEVNNADGIAIGGHVLDADLRRVDPDTYRLLLGIEDTTCDTSITMTIR